MVDFLKANPYMTMEDYLWNYSIPYIRLMALDNSRVNYLTDKDVENRKKNVLNIGSKDANQLNNDLGMKIKM